MFRVAPNLEILRDLDRVTQDQASFLCLTAFTEWFLMDPTTRGPMVVAAYRTAQREAGLPDPGTDAMEVAALLLKAIDRMPCTAHDFLGTALYRRAAKIAGWPMEDDAQDDATA